MMIPNDQLEQNRIAVSKNITEISLINFYTCCLIIYLSAAILIFLKMNILTSWASWLILGMNKNTKIDSYDGNNIGNIETKIL